MTAEPLEYPGVDNSREFAEWLWDSGIAAVCTDSPGFEAMRMFLEQSLTISPYLIPTGTNSAPRLFPAPRAARRLRDAHWRAVCAGRAGGAVRKGRTRDVFLYKRAAECCWGSGESAERAGYFLAYTITEYVLVLLLIVQSVSLYRSLSGLPKEACKRRTEKLAVHTESVAPYMRQAMASPR